MKSFLFIISPLRSPSSFKKWLFQENKYKEQRSVIYPVRYLLGAKVLVSYDVETGEAGKMWVEHCFNSFISLLGALWICCFLCLPMEVIKTPHCILALKSASPGLSPYTLFLCYFHVNRKCIILLIPSMILFVFVFKSWVALFWAIRLASNSLGLKISSFFSLLSSWDYWYTPPWPAPSFFVCWYCVISSPGRKYIIWYSKELHK